MSKREKILFGLYFTTFGAFSCFVAYRACYAIYWAFTQ